MQVKGGVLLVGLLLAALPALASTGQPERLLRVYGPGGPHAAMAACAERYREHYGYEVAVIRAMPQELERRLAEDGDIYFGGAEYMLVDVVERNPELLDLQTAENLHPRRIGILTRRGNPLGISGLDDLQRDGVDLLDVKLENMQSFQTGPGGERGRIREVVYTGQHGVSAWLEREHIDAWITYRSWHLQLEEHAEFIDLSAHPQGQRYTPVAVTSHSRQREVALHFIDFLKSDAAREIFEAHGWY